MVLSPDVYLMRNPAPVSAKITEWLFTFSGETLSGAYVSLPPRLSHSINQNKILSIGPLPEDEKNFYELKLMTTKSFYEIGLTSPAKATVLKARWTLMSEVVGFEDWARFYFMIVWPEQKIGRVESRWMSGCFGPWKLIIRNDDNLTLKIRAGPESEDEAIRLVETLAQRKVRLPSCQRTPLREETLVWRNILSLPSFGDNRGQIYFMDELLAFLSCE